MLKEPISPLHHHLHKQGQQKLFSSKDLKLHNDVNIAYTGPIMLGSPTQGDPDSQFVYDTGSGFLTIASRECRTCSRPYYSPNLSKTAVSGVSGYEKTSLEYGSATIKGRMYTDRVCLNDQIEETCLNEFGFFLIES